MTDPFKHVIPPEGYRRVPDGEPLLEGVDRFFHVASRKVASKPVSFAGRKLKDGTVTPDVPWDDPLRFAGGRLSGFFVQPSGGAVVVEKRQQPGRSSVMNISAARAAARALGVEQRRAPPVAVEPEGPVSTIKNPDLPKGERVVAIDCQFSPYAEDSL